MVASAAEQHRPRQPSGSFAVASSITKLIRASARKLAPFGHSFALR